ncbi:MAG: RsmB/NOP family class I SAM-dependent RNA methyltransferase [Nanoarchaeota archaeon]
MNIFLDRYKQLGQDIVPEKIKIVQAIRVNTLKMKEEELLKRMKKENVVLVKIPFLDFGYYVQSTNFSVGAASEHLFGYYYVQETAAQIPVQILNPKKTDVVLDMSAAPGGKTTQIAQYMGNEGVIVALDINNLRLFSLRNNIERMGVKNTIIFQKDAKFVSDLGVKFDKILLDAPCSGNFAVDSKWFDKRKLEDIKNSSKIQKHFFAAAVDVLNDDGELVYSTCSLEPEENELVVDWVLTEFPNLKLEKIDIPIGDDGLIEPFGIKLNKSIKNTRRFWPNKTNTQGFFIAKFKKTK